MSVGMNGPSTKRRGTGGSMVNQSGPSSLSSQASNASSTGSVSVPVSADLASLFECPVCFDYVLPPILQCQSGHLVCSNCRPKLTCCPTCRGPLGNIRNLAMEKVASTVLFPCKYSTSGCTMSLLHTLKAEHEEICEYRPYSCPCPGASCKWQGALEQVMPHLMMSHKSITTLQVSSFHGPLQFREQEKVTDPVIQGQIWGIRWLRYH
ncbi:E3 ubiquitin-protein ligase siah1b [Homalodisca vitripennis]|nr:E3 ubiquitin-protein ligase siah1b [Homalodisca vitripennis]